MERLVTTTQAAQLLGLSLQGIHYRIKKNQLKSIKKSGKTFVYIDDNLAKQSNVNVNNSSKSYNNQDVIDVKNEQIVLLKKSIKWMKKQHNSEIARLEKSQNNIINVFNSEIKLLQSAFNEMRSIYKPMLNSTNEINESKNEFITLKDFSIIMKRHNKSQNEIKLIILKAIKKADNRFIYNKKDKKLLILNASFEDLV